MARTQGLLATAKLRAFRLVLLFAVLLGYLPHLDLPIAINLAESVVNLESSLPVDWALTGPTMHGMSCIGVLFVEQIPRTVLVVLMAAAASAEITAVDPNAFFTAIKGLLDRVTHQ